jgi:hypothetical protein
MLKHAANRKYAEGTFMTRWIGAAILAASLTCYGSAAISAAATAPNPDAPKAGDPAARHGNSRQVHTAARPVSQPTYYDRPNGYRPYPYALPAPFFLGIAFEPW